MGKSQRKSRKVVLNDARYNGKFLFEALSARLDLALLAWRIVQRSHDGCV